MNEIFKILEISQRKNKKYVQFVPFDIKNISPETYERFRRALPLSYGTIMQVGVGSQIR